MFSFPPKTEDQQPLDDYGALPEEPLEPDIADEQPPEEPGATPIDYSINLSKERRDKLASFLCDQIDRWYETVQNRLDNLQEWRRAYELIPVAAPERWPGSATTPADFTRTACEAHHTRLNAQIIQPDPLYVVAREPEAIDAAPRIEEAMSARLEEAEWPLAADDVHADLPVAGDMFLRVTWDEEYKRVPEVQVDWDENRYRALIVAGMPPAEAMLEAQTRDAQGRLTRELAHKDVLTFAGTRFKPIPFEDGVLFPATVRDPLQAIGMGERVTLIGKELLDGIKTGRYIEEEVGELLKMHGDPTPEDRLEKLDHAGLSDVQGEPEMAREEARYREYQCYNLDILWDANDDGQDERCLVTLHKDSRRILRLVYSPYEHGECCYHMFRYGARPGELLGFSVAEIIACYQDAGSAILCHLTDHADLMLALGSTFVVDPAAGLDPNKFVLRMGQPILAKNPTQTIRDLPLPKLPTEHYNAYQLYKDRVDSVSGATNVALGKVTDTERTLGEVEHSLANSNMIFETIAAGVARQWARVWDQMRYLEAQYGDGGMVKYRKSAAAGTLIETPDGGMQPAGPEFETISAEMLLSQVDLVPAGLQQLSDTQSKLNQALLLMKTFAESPVTAGNLEVQMIALENLMRAARFTQVEKVLAAIQKQQFAQAVQQQQQQQVLAELAASGALDQAALPPKGGTTGAQAGPQAAAPPMPAGPEQPPPIGTV